MGIVGGLEFEHVLGSEFALVGLSAWFAELEAVKCVRLEFYGAPGAESKLLN